MSVTSSANFAILSLLLITCVRPLFCVEMPSEGEFDWEDFHNAIEEDDCFGGHCGAASGALSMMQTKASFAISADVAAMRDIPTEDIMEAIESDDLAGMGALSLVQTGASLERAAVPTHGSMTVAAVQADGSIEVAPRTETMPHDGMMHLSVDAHGHVNSEDGFAFSLLQTEAHVESSSAWEDDDVILSESNDYEENEGMSMMQTGIEESSRESVDEFSAISVGPDASMELKPRDDILPSDGMMTVAVDAHGDFHEEGFSLIQSQAEMAEDFHPSWTLEADDVHLERKGTSTSQEGVVQMSVDSQGHLEREL